MTMAVPVIGILSPEPACIVGTLRDYCPTFIGCRKWGPEHGLPEV